MIITVDTDILDEYRMTPNDYVYLAALMEDKEPMKNIYLKLNIKHLTMKGFIEIHDGDAYITDKTREMFKIPREGFVSPKINLGFSSPDSMKSLAEKYRSYFPKGVRSGGYLVRGTKESCEKKLKAFIRKYPDYDESIILEATKRYINRKAKEAYTHMKLAPYFIEKDGISMLAAECEELISEGTDGRSDDDWGKDV